MGQLGLLLTAVAALQLGRFAPNRTGPMGVVLPSELSGSRKTQDDVDAIRAAPYQDFRLGWLAESGIQLRHWQDEEPHRQRGFATCGISSCRWTSGRLRANDYLAVLPLCWGTSKNTARLCKRAKHSEYANSGRHNIEYPREPHGSKFYLTLFAPRFTIFIADVVGVVLSSERRRSSNPISKMFA